MTPGHELRDTGGDFFPLISLSDSVPLPLTSYPLPCPVLWPASVARVYLLPTLSFVPLVVVRRAVTWGPFGIYLGAALKSFFERQRLVRYSEVNPMKCSLFYQP